MKSAINLLALTDFLAVLFSAVLTKLVYLQWYLGIPLNVYPYFLIAVGLALTLNITYTQFQLYDVEKVTGPGESFRNILSGLALSFLIILGILYLLKQSEDISRGWVLVWFMLATAIILPLRTSFVRWIRQGVGTGRLTRSTAIIGTPEFVLSLDTIIGQASGTTGSRDLYALDGNLSDARLAGSLSDLERLLTGRRYDRVIVAIPASMKPQIQLVIKSLGSYAAELLLCTDLRTPPIMTIGSFEVSGTRVDVVHMLPPSERLWLLRRVIELIITTTALVVLSPLLLLVAIAIKLDSRGDVLFRQHRLGQNNSVFPIYKFRSMTVMEDGANVVQAVRNDSRVTRVGRFIRATSIDELPQLFNVLLGHMSLIGPRPHAIAHDQAFEQQFDQFSRRRRVRPGMTGWAQVNGFRGETKHPEDVRRRMEQDLFYINNWTIWLDLEIMARTLLVFSKGAY